jgi:ribose 5-phosphate isomerase A
VVATSKKSGFGFGIWDLIRISDFGFRICPGTLGPMDAKQRAGEEAVSLVQSGMIVGLGTGSTADFFLRALADRIADGRLKDIRGLPTSRASEQKARQLGIPIATFAECPHADVTIDGADEIDPSLNLIKGRGGALLREKVVAQNSTQLVIIADDSKKVAALGTRFPLPVEVTVFGFETQQEFLSSLGCVPNLRMLGDKPFVTDNGNYIYDCKFPRIDNPLSLESALGMRAGIVESGLFLGIAKIAIVAGKTDVERLQR